MSPLLEPLFHCFPPLQVVTVPKFEFPKLYSEFPLAIYFTYGSIYVSMLLSRALDF